MKFELNEYHRDVSDEKLISDLKRVVYELNKKAVTREEYTIRGKYHDRTLRTRFGSWLKTLEKAGLEKAINRNIPEDELFQNLEEVWVKLGRQPSCIEIESY